VKIGGNSTAGQKSVKSPMWMRGMSRVSPCRSGLEWESAQVGRGDAYAERRWLGPGWQGHSLMFLSNLSTQELHEELIREPPFRGGRRISVWGHQSDSPIPGLYDSMVMFHGATNTTPLWGLLKESFIATGQSQCLHCSGTRITR
jgi:hypothetical protein